MAEGGGRRAGRNSSREHPQPHVSTSAHCPNHAPRCWLFSLSLALVLLKRAKYTAAQQREREAFTAELVAQRQAFDQEVTHAPPRSRDVGQRSGQEAETCQGSQARRRPLYLFFAGVTGPTSPSPLKHGHEFVPCLLRLDFSCPSPPPPPCSSLAVVPSERRPGRRVGRAQ